MACKVRIIAFGRRLFVRESRREGVDAMRCHIRRTRIALEGPGQEGASCASVIPSLPGTPSSIEHRGLHRRSLAAVGFFLSRVCVFCRASWSGSSGGGWGLLFSQRFVFFVIARQTEERQETSNTTRLRV
ncbi:hypothetical protein TEQG_03777 [Trichophyton equinum CBS 127.97]|uniref:Uncharacterized protein n=1 Tax=Trichophyton equinum (strain ATCC MYA-4606 / CBS 127.97) TaxID=559882 RepID=F2PSR5_TRIEC|nr:hypothetical protein TEQG_03777 [Trichophyton equinum CBS 127.97]